MQIGRAKSQIWPAGKELGNPVIKAQKNMTGLAP